MHHGNIGVATRDIEIKDIVPPELTLNGNAYQNIYVGGTYDEDGATARDDLDGDISSKVQISGNVDTSKAGTYTVHYEVTDASGNKTKKDRKVAVIEKSQTAGIIYLTFDDGPSVTSTPYILDILKEEGVKATFFIINYNENTEYLVKRIVDEGHTIAIHGYSHDYNQIYQSVDAYMENITKLRDKI